MVGFVEKPAIPTSDLANAGLYAFSPRVLDDIPQPLPRDIGADLIPRLVGRTGVVSIDDSYFLDIGTPPALELARAQWEGRASA
jgi:mannose-1-phosphate guanylyltransferase